MFIINFHCTFFFFFLSFVFFYTGAQIKLSLVSLCFPVDILLKGHCIENGKYKECNLPTINPKARPSPLPTVAAAVAVVRCSGGNQVLENVDGAAYTTGLARLVTI